ncbi:MAG: hypothetical protein C0602_07705 [Denitrovibrio sp.]|nr:MAG: hypothetical protein C0602_07705 [Denitrovibrio sp.]
MYDISNITSIIDGKSTVAPSEKVRSVDKIAEKDIKTEEQPSSKTPKKEEVTQAVSDLKAALDSMNVKREFSIEENSKELIVKIMDPEEKKVIRQIPSEETLRLSKNIKEMVGLLYDSTS